MSDMTEKIRLMIINGPNLNMLGIREPDKYGRETYNDLKNKIKAHAKEKNISVTFRQSNHEGDLVDFIQSTYKKYDGIVINPGAYTHTSIAILDAVRSVMTPTAEVHISNLSKRENYRHISYIREACILSVIGEGTDGYLTAIDRLCEFIIKHKEEKTII